MNSVRKGLTAAAVAASLVGGGALAGALLGATSSGAATTTSSAASTAASPAPAAPRFDGPPHGTAAHEDAEKAVTGEAAAKAQAAAVKSVGDGSAGAVTTDYTGSGYETTVTKSDGTTVEVHLDSSYNVMQGPGAPGHGMPPSGAPGRGAPPPAG
jgi:nicotinic acid phosphoribosyltransferase